MLSAAEIACMTATVEESLDQALTLSRDTFTADIYGNSTVAGTTTSAIQVNVIKPTATELQMYADRIGSKRSLILRAMQTTDIRQNDHLTYDGLEWYVNGVLDANSYSFTRKYLIVVIA
jgi:hypothetical protein